MFDQTSHKISVPLSDDAGLDDFAYLNSLKTTSESWREHEAEGQLAVDIIQTDDELIVVAPMAGTPSNLLEMHLHNDLLTIRGERFAPIDFSSEYLCRECYWGKFSRTIVLPVDIKVEMASAEYKNGVLTIRLPKVKSRNEIPILVVEE